MEHIAPLIQTVLWVGLVVGIVIRFHRPIHNLLVALERRIEAGSSVEAGPFRLGEVKPTSPVQQRQRTEAELAQIVQDQLEPPAAGAAFGVPTALTESKQLRSRFFQAEELALRAVQTEYNEPLNRQVSIAPGIEADGAFLRRGDLHLVEVKYIVRPKNAISTVRRTLDHYKQVFGPTRARTITVILALVFEYDSDVSASTLQLQEIANESGLRVEVKGYSLRQLQATYGLPADEA
jgi:hypothetical protein